MVKRTLRKYSYPPDKQEKATQTVLEQAELLCMDWDRLVRRNTLWAQSLGQACGIKKMRRTRNAAGTNLG